MAGQISKPLYLDYNVPNKLHADQSLVTAIEALNNIVEINNATYNIFKEIDDIIDMKHQLQKIRYTTMI